MTLGTKTLGLIGVGNMGTSILEGLIRQSLISARQVFIFDKFTEKAEAFENRYSVQKSGSNAELVRVSDIILLAIKPQDLGAVSEEFKAELSRGKIVISILAGMTLDKLEQSMGTEASIVRAMPNLGAKVGESLTALDGKDKSSLAAAEVVFSGCGKTVLLPEVHFDMFTALAGSGPAYFFLLMETIEKKALEQGFSPEAARLTAVQTAVGAALAARSAPESSAELRRMVTSKGGTTEAALNVLESGKIRELFSSAYDAAAARGRELRGS